MIFNELGRRNLRTHNRYRMVLHVSMVRSAAYTYVRYVDKVTAKRRYLLQGCDWVVWV